MVAAWLLVGAAYALSLIGMASIGILILPVAVVGTVMLAVFPWTRPGLPGLISGLGLPPVYVAFLNRSGPANICRATVTGEECVQGFNPWPGLAAAVVRTVAGGAVFLLSSDRHPKS